MKYEKAELFSHIYIEQIILTCTVLTGMIEMLCHPRQSISTL